MQKDSYALKPRAEMQAACFKGKAAYIFGGYYEDFRFTGSAYHNDGIRFGHSGDDLICSSLLPVTPDCPSSRGGATFTTDPTRKRALLIGGYETMQRREVLNDVWECRVSRRLDSMATKSRFVECQCCKSKGMWPVCSRCNSVRYCSRTCQKNDWSDHKENCK